MKLAYLLDYCQKLSRGSAAERREGDAVKKDIIRRLFPKRDQETIESFEKGTNFRHIQFLVCDNCYYILTGSTVVSEDEIKAAKFRSQIEAQHQSKKDKAQFDSYIKHIKAMHLKETGVQNTQNFTIDKLS